MNVPAGTYTLTVVDINGCAVSDTTTITEPLLPLTLEIQEFDIFVRAQAKAIKGTLTGTVGIKRHFVEGDDVDHMWQVLVSE